MQKRINIIDKKKGFGSDKVWTFFLTVNTNSQDLISEVQMRAVAEQFFNQIENYFRFLNRKFPETNNVSHVDSIDIETAVEKGKKQERVHLHGLIKVRHRTKIQLDLRKIHSFFTEALRLKNIYVNVKYVPDNDISLLKYMRK